MTSRVDAPHPRGDDPRMMRIACLGLGALLATLGLYFVFNGALNADEGFYLQASRLVGDGLRPYADFGFTQTPILPYANLPWLHLFGFDLLGQRLAGLMWTAAAVVAGAIALRRSGWPPLATFSLLLAAAPGWMAFVAMGKTYAFAGFAVMLGTVALISDWSLEKRWALFLGAAALGVGTRLPTAAFFAVAGCGLLLETPGWKRRSSVIAITIVLAGATIVLFAAGAWEQTWFWTVDYHRHSSFDRPWWMRLREFAATGPAVWLASGFALFAAIKGKSPSSRILALALVVAVVANLGGRTTYGEYVIPFVPAAALFATPWLTDRVHALRPWGRAALLAGVAASAFILPPRTSRTVLLNAAGAAAALREFVPPESYVVASMPEVPLTSGHPTYPQLALGKFALTEDFPPDVAARMHLVTGNDLVQLLEDERTGALAFSDSWVWNFGWSVPSLRWVPQETSDRISAAIRRHYVVVFKNRDYVVFARGDSTSTPTGNASTATLLPRQDSSPEVDAVAPAAE